MTKGNGKMGFLDPISKLHLTYLRRLWIYFALTEGQFITQPMKKTSHYLCCGIPLAHVWQ